MKKSKKQERTAIKEQRIRYFEEKGRKAKKMCRDCAIHFLLFALLAAIIDHKAFLYILPEYLITALFWGLAGLSVVAAILAYRWYDGWMFQMQMQHVSRKVFENLEKELGKYDKSQDCM